MKSRLFRHAAVVLAAALTLAAAGCGGTKTGVSAQSGTSLVRSGALAYVSIDSDLGSSQWKQVDSLAKKFPGRNQALAYFKHELAKQGVDYNRDVKPAVGPEVDIAVLRGATPKDTAFAVLTKPEDGGKYKALVKKLNAHDTSGKPAVYRKVGGWYALSESQKMIDRVLAKGGASLSDDSTFKQALGELPKDALAKAYVNSRQLGGLIKQASQESDSPLGSFAFGFDKLDFISAALSAENDGLRLHGVAKGPGAGQFGRNYKSKLIDGVPADALGFLTFRGTGLRKQFGQLESKPAVRKGFEQFRRVVGVSVDDLLALFGGETGFYARPGALIPEFTLVLTPRQPGRAVATLNTLARRIASFTGATIAGGAEKTVDFGPVSIRYGAAKDKVIVTNSANGVATFGAPGKKLPDSAAFRDAKSAAGMPGSNAGFFYIDVKGSVRLIESLAGLAGDQSLPPEVTGNLRPLRSFLAWGTVSGDTGTFDAFLEIK
jgi:hypothetical protein